MADVSLSSFAGIRNTLPPERIQTVPSRENARVDVVEAVNVDFDNSGQAARRDGTTLRRAGAAHSLWSGKQDCLFASGRTLYRLNADYSATALVADLAEGMPLAYLELDGRVYWSDGVHNGILAGTPRAWGMPIPLSPSLAGIAGTLAAGTYLAALTTVREDGLESGAGLPASIVLGEGAGVRFGWDVPTDASITHVNLYLSEPNGMVLYRAATVAAAAGVANVTGAALAVPINTQWLDQPPPGQALAYSRGRIYIAQGPFVFATAPHGYEHCDLRDYLALDGTHVGLLLGVDGGLFVGTQRATYFLSGARLEDMDRRVVVPAPVIPGSALLVDGMAATGNAELAGRELALFATTAGVCLGMPDGSIANLTAERYAMAAGAQGAAVFRHTDQHNQYLLFLQQ